MWRYGFATACMLMMVGRATASDRPNVIFFVTDDLCDWISPMGYRQAITPNLDRLAKRGVTFQQAHAPGVFCAPSRTAIMTGRFASTTGCYSTEIYFYDHPELRPLQVAFHEVGYETYGAGKVFHHPAGYVDLRGWTEFFVRSRRQREEGWPLDTWGPDTPIPQPFPHSIYNRGREITGGLFLEWGEVPNEKEEEMADTIRVNWACDVLRREHDAPFFLAVGLYVPHFPNYAPQKYFDLYDPEKIELPPYKEDDIDDLPEPLRRWAINRRKAHHDRLVELDAVDDAIRGYLAATSYADAMLGRVLDTLDASPYAENTIIVFWADQGYHHGEKGHWGKHTLWERTTNAPFIWAGPRIARGRSVDLPVSLIDIYPTLVDMCNLKEDPGLEGESLRAILAEPDRAAEMDRCVFVPHVDPGSYAVINRKWRYIRYADGTEELYDIQKDPNEWYNLAGDPRYEEVKKALASRAPSDFAPPATPKNRLRLVPEGESFHWEPKR
ncbi:hypothetical protein JCM19992_18840 [Thermostilla marina]